MNSQRPLGRNRLAAEAVSQSRFRILVVDDEPLLREISKVVLEGIGYEVLTASNGLEGLDALSKFPPDIIISDLNMPRMSGFEFLAIVRQRFPHIGTIAMSGGHSTGDIPSGVLADAFVQKANYSIKELSHQVAKLLANRVPANGRRAIFNPICCICSNSLTLETCKVDEFGKAVHEECYVLKLIAA